MAPFVVTFSAPETVEAPRIKALVSFSVTLRPLVIATVLKLLALSKVISLPAPAASVVVPVTARFPLSVSVPAVVTFNVPAIVDVRRSNALLSTNVTLRPDVIPIVLKLFDALFSVISLAAPAARDVVPVTFSAPLWVIAPSVVTPNVPDTVEAPRIKRISIVQRDIATTGDCNRAEVIGVVQRDIVPCSCSQRGRAGDHQIATVGDRHLRLSHSGSRSPSKSPS